MFLYVNNVNFLICYSTAIAWNWQIDGVRTFVPSALRHTVVSKGNTSPLLTRGKKYVTERDVSKVTQPHDE